MKKIENYSALKLGRILKDIVDTIKSDPDDVETLDDVLEMAVPFDMTQREETMEIAVEATNIFYDALKYDNCVGDEELVTLNNYDKSVIIRHIKEHITN